MPKLPVKRDLIIVQGDDWEWPMRLLSGGSLINTSGHGLRMQIRADYDSPVIVDLTTGNGRAQVGIQSRGSTSINLWLTLTNATTAGLTDWGCGRYDIEWTDGSGRVRKLFYGTATLQREVTR